MTEASDPRSQAVAPGRATSEYRLAQQALWVPVAVLALLVFLVALGRMPVEGLLAVLPLVLGGSWLSTAYTKGRSAVKTATAESAASIVLAEVEKGSTP